MANLPKGLQDRIKRSSAQVKREMEERSPYSSRRIDLSGKNAIVQPGGSATIRLLPGGTDDPEEVYFQAKQHWIDTVTPKGQFRIPVWCPSTFDERCPICEHGDTLARSMDPADKKAAPSMNPRLVFLWNAIQGKSGARKMDDGVPKVGYITISDTMCSKIFSLMTGGEDQEFAYGAIYDPVEGYDLRFIRPAKQGEQWDVKAAPRPSLLFKGVDSDKTPREWKGWTDRLIDLADVVRTEMKDFSEIYKMLHGEDPDDDEVPTSKNEEEWEDEDGEEEVEEEEVDEDGEDEADEEEADEDDDDFDFDDEDEVDEEEEEGDDDAEEPDFDEDEGEEEEEAEEEPAEQKAKAKKVSGKAKAKKTSPKKKTPSKKSKKKG